MKHLNLIILFTIVCAGILYTHKSINAAATTKGPGLELRNQSDLNIMIRLFIKGKKVADEKIAHDSIFQWEINLDDPVIVEVYEPILKHTLNKIEINAKGKTKYITWDPKKYNKPDKYFFPQSSYTNLSSDMPASEFDLENNVEQSDIKRVR